MEASYKFDGNTLLCFIRGAKAPNFIWKIKRSVLSERGSDLIIIFHFLGKANWGFYVHFYLHVDSIWYFILPKSWIWCFLLLELRKNLNFQLCNHWSADYGNNAQVFLFSFISESFRLHPLFIKEMIQFFTILYSCYILLSSSYLLFDHKKLMPARRLPTTTFLQRRLRLRT